MTEWKRRRFWTEATTEARGPGHGILLDGRMLRTPAGQELVVPSAALAERIAAEWKGAGEEIDPRRMPFTRSANSALDTVSTNRAHIVDMLSAYGGSDLVCYRADRPVDLAARQAEAWNPLLDWVATALSAPLRPVVGLMPEPQPRASLDRLAGEVAALDDFRLTGLHDLVTLSGSLVIGLSVVHGARGAEEAWAASRIDEEYQAEQWGHDEEAVRAAEDRWSAFAHSATLLSYC